MIRKIVLEQHQSPGDIVVMTGAVRDLKKIRPDYQIMPDTTCMDVWQDNPNVSFFNRADADVEFFNIGYDDIHNSNISGRHFSNAFHLAIGEALGLSIPQTSIYPDLYAPKLLPGVFSVPLPAKYWVLNAGYKKDFPLKDWGAENYQQLVNILRGVVEFVQVGEDSPDHVHPVLSGVTRIVGSTSMRDFIYLCSNAQGSVGPVSMHSHVMAGFKKPCVVIAGGREPYRWEAYPNQRYLHTNGFLPCCDGIGCWKKWLNADQAPERDRVGDWQDKICVNTTCGRARCLEMIAPDAVANEVLNYYRGGILK